MHCALCGSYLPHVWAVTTDTEDTLGQARISAAESSYARQTPGSGATRG